MKKRALILAGVIACQFASSQIIPPGLGKTNAASWLAFGIQQDLDTIKGKGWESTTYIGLGRMSSPDNDNPIEKPAIFIFNQEFKNRFQKNWEYSLAFSYRRQDEYASVAPYEHESPSIKQEFRFYGRFSYIAKTGILEITPTFRQEVQKYFNPDFSPYSESLKLRSRFRLKLSFQITPDKTHRIILYSEQLFSTSLMKDPEYWTKFGYKDSRFAAYYSFSPKKIPWTFNLGYMNNLMGNKKPASAHYIGLDLILKNPFSK